MKVVSHYRRQAPTRAIPICPECGKDAQERETRFGLRNSCCGLWSWDRHPLADQRTHEARKAAHAAFDSLWKNGGPMSRGKAYAALRARLGLSEQDCHMKVMDAATAEMVPDAVRAIRAEMEAKE